MTVRKNKQRKDRSGVERNYFNDPQCTEDWEEGAQNVSKTGTKRTKV